MLLGRLCSPGHTGKRGALPFLFHGLHPFFLCSKPYIPFKTKSKVLTMACRAPLLPYCPSLRAVLATLLLLEQAEQAPTSGPLRVLFSRVDSLPHLLQFLVSPPQ